MDTGYYLWMCTLYIVNVERVPLLYGHNSLKEWNAIMCIGINKITLRMKRTVMDFEIFILIVDIKC